MKEMVNYCHVSFSFVLISLPLGCFLRLAFLDHIHSKLRLAISKELRALRGYFAPPPI